MREDRSRAWPRSNGQRRQGRRTVAVVLGALLLSCSAKSPAPQLPPASTLTPRPVPPAPSELAIVYAGPRGEAVLGSSIQVLFNQPLRAAEAAAATPPPPVELTPAVKGEWQWLGARALTFFPVGGRLPAATSFRVVVPAGTRALSGKTLAEPFSFEFETPAPLVTSSEPAAGAEGLEPASRIVLRFNQPISAKALEQSARLRVLRAGNERELAFSARSRPERPNELEIVPRAPLPLASRIELAVAAGLRGTEGPRPLASEHVLRFDTYGPLRVLGVNCSVLPQTRQCDPEGSLWIELSNPVSAKEVRSRLTIEPPLELSWSDDVEHHSRYVYLPLSRSLSPATSYKVRLGAGLRDQYGQALAAEREQTLTTGNYSPLVRLPIEGEIFPAPLDNLALESRNAADLHLVWRKLEGEQLLDFYPVRYDGEQLRRWINRLGPSAAAVPALLDNQLQREPLPLARLLGADTARGAVWVGWRYAGHPTQGQLLQVTDLALTAKLSDRGSLVWVTRLSDGSSVPGASVRLLGRQPALDKRYQTDAQGLVAIPPADFHPVFQDYGSEQDTLIIVRAGDDVSFRRIADFMPPWRIPLEMRLSQPERDVALLFSDRGIYRPGDTVELKGILRKEQSAGSAPIVARKLNVALEDPQGEVAEKLSVETTRFGTFAARVALPGSAALGHWRLVAEGFDDAALGLNVAEYRSVEFKVRVAAAEPSRREGEIGRFDVQADYLFGSPMAGRALRYSATRERRQFAPPGAEGYVTDEDAFRADLAQSALEASVFARGEATLSPRGSFHLDLPLQLPGQIGPEQVRLDAEVSDLSRQTVSASAALLVHPAEHYLAIAELDTPFQRAPAKLSPRVLALDPEGKRVSRPVQLELVRRRWTIAREQTEEGWRTVSQPVDETQARCQLKTGAQPASCELALAESGQFFVRASSPDERGHVARSALGFYALGEGRSGWADNDQRQLSLVLDKPEYRVGERARILIKSPFPRAEALLTVERAGLYEHRRLTLEGPAPSVEIPIDERLRPNAFVAVHLVQGVQANLPPTPLEVTPEPGYRFGYAQLLVNADDRRLKVEIRGQEASYRPRERVKLQLGVQRADGQPLPAELTVYAVDEGVLALSNYTPPDPLQRFTAPRPLAVATLETREALGRVLLPGPDRDKGMEGGDGGGGAGLRSNFKTTAYFNPALLADSQGRAELEFELPDNLTTYRLMAVAVSEDDRYGVSSVPLVVNRPLTIRPALPRRLRAGDRLQASALLNVLGSQRAPVKVSAEVSGATLHGSAQRELTLGADGAAEVRFELEAKTPGELKLRLAASSGALTDSVEVTRPISAPLALEASALYGRTETSEAQALGDLSSLRSDVGGVELELASTALVGLESGLQQLIDYPYVCTEQLASRVLPLGPLAGLAERYGVALPERARALEAQAGEILRRQRGDGGFALWPSSVESQPWVSAYTLWVLWHAKQAGARLPQRTFDQGVAYLRQWLASAADAPDAREPLAARLATAALMVDTLAALGQPDAEYLTRLYERRHELPTFGRALLLHAAASKGTGAAPDAALLATLTQELERLITVRGNKATLEEPLPEGLEETFHSEGRSEALALWALLSAQPAHPLGAALAQGLLDRRDSGMWQNTQEAAYALLALDTYRRAQEGTLPEFTASVWLGERRLLEASFSGATVLAQRKQLSFAELGQQPANLIFGKQGNGALFYELRLRYAPRELPSEPLERGFAVQKGQRSVTVAELERVLREAPNPAVKSQSFAGGDLVLVDLLVAAPAQRHFVVIEDPLPAGLEAIDARLATTSAELDLGARPAQTGSGSEPSRFQTSWYRQELRDDRVLFFVDHMPAGIYHYRYLARATTIGRFVVPPTRVAEMYQPEVFARSAAGHVEVR